MKWTLCSEKMPYEGSEPPYRITEFIATMQHKKKGGGWDTYVGPIWLEYDKKSGKKWWCIDSDDHKVIAWMPFPEPYEATSS